MAHSVHCGKHGRRNVEVMPPPWAPQVLDWAAIRALLTGCPCADPDPAAFDALWQEIQPMLHGLEDEVASGVIRQTPLTVRGRPLAALLDRGTFDRIFRQLDARGGGGRA